MCDSRVTGTKAQLIDSRGDLQLQNQVLVFTQSLDHKVCVQSRMEQSVVKVTPEGPAICQVGVWGRVHRSWPGAHPLRVWNSGSLGCPRGLGMGKVEDFIVLWHVNAGMSWSLGPNLQGHSEVSSC